MSADESSQPPAGGDQGPAPLAAPSRIGTYNLSGPHGKSLPVRIPVDEDWRLHNIFKKHEYSLPKMVRAPEAMTVVDIGANVGAFSLYAKNWAARVRIHAFEPNPQVFRLLKENLAPFDDVHLHWLALADRSGEQALYVNDLNTGQASLHAYKEASEAPRVPVRPAGAALAHLGGAPIHVLKIDTEGSEPAILESMAGLLPQVSIVMLEYHSEADRHRIDAALAQFSLVEAQIHGPGIGTLKYVNNAGLVSRSGA